MVREQSKYFLTVLSTESARTVRELRCRPSVNIIMRGERMVREQSKYFLTVLSTESARTVRELHCRPSVNIIK